MATGQNRHPRQLKWNRSGFQQGEQAMAAGKYKAVALQVADAEEEDDVWQPAAIRLDISKTPAEFVGKTWGIIFETEDEALEYAELQLSMD
jgi:hypothetical protein